MDAMDGATDCGDPVETVSTHLQPRLPQAYAHNCTADWRICPCQVVGITGFAFLFDGTRSEEEPLGLSAGGLTGRQLGHLLVRGRAHLGLGAGHDFTCQRRFRNAFSSFSWSFGALAIRNRYVQTLPTKCNLNIHVVVGQQMESIKQYILI